MINYNSKIHSETNNNNNYIKQPNCKILEIQLIFRKKKHKFETKTKITKPQSKLERERLCTVATISTWKYTPKLKIWTIKQPNRKILEIELNFRKEKALIWKESEDHNTYSSECEGKIGSDGEQARSRSNWRPRAEEEARTRSCRICGRNWATLPPTDLRSRLWWATPAKTTKWSWDFVRG